MKRKTILTMILMLACVFLAGTALAGDINPNMAETMRIEKMSIAEDHGIVANGVVVANDSSAPISALKTKAPTLGGTGSWQIQYNTGTYGKVNSVKISLLMKDWSSDYTTIYAREYSGAAYSFTTPTILSGGSYKLYIWANFTSNYSGYGYVDSEYFTIADDAYHTSLTEKVSQVVSSCKSSTTWQTALKLHDWLTNHAYYDKALEFYGAEGVLLRGKGVCDSYSKAYYMLCRAAGISIYRVTGNAGGLHAWNAIKLDGEWYYVDPTWDDPSGGTSAVSGNENHNYFCLNETLMSLDHTNDKAAFTGSCTSLDANYYIHTGKWKKWGAGYYYSGGVCYVTPFYKELQDAINSGDTSWTSAPSTIWTGETGDVYGFSGNKRHFGIVSWGLNHTPLSISDGGAISVTSTYTSSSVSAKLKGWVLSSSGTLKLPANTKVIPAQAFYGIAATTVKIPSSCTTINSKAFAASSVRTVYIPAKVTTIASDAFDGCKRLIFITTNSTAISYAKSHNYIVLSP